MVIAFLALLGVDLVVIVVFLAFVLSRQRWVDRQPGAFKGAIRLVDGEFEGVASKWRRGYGRWVRDVFVWTKAPFLFRNELLPADGVEEQRPAASGEVKRLGDHPTVTRVKVWATPLSRWQHRPKTHNASSGHSVDAHRHGSSTTTVLALTRNVRICNSSAWMYPDRVRLDALTFLRSSMPARDAQPPDTTLGRHLSGIMRFV